MLILVAGPLVRDSMVKETPQTLCLEGSGSEWKKLQQPNALLHKTLYTVYG